MPGDSMTGGDIRQVTGVNMVNDNTSSKSMSSNIEKLYRYKRSVRIPENHAVSGKQYKQDLKLFTTINKRIDKLASR